MSYSCKTPDEILKVIKDDKIEMVDLRFTDLPGLWQHFSVPPRALSLDCFSDGVGFDGSSIRGFQEIQESDMMVVDTVQSFGIDGREAEAVLDRVGIAVNKQILPDDPNPPLRPSGIR
ncbi:MAG: glutamine synthetase beta-grasp domain-containing protein, partial [Beijerinckiaceae bacterium]|nr:glutamine synthetase beta-grasp domain-containing protein [Beijerinckiaceae bacterium]